MLQDKGFKDALVTDGRMSGASGKVPAAIHVTPEPLDGGAIGNIRDGDLIRVDAEAGLLECDTDLTPREPLSHDLKSIAGPFPDIKFCPTGGISADKAPSYLALSNVACVGGSWIATRQMIVDSDWQEIEENARRARGLL